MRVRSRLSWWQKSRLAACLIAGLGFVLAVFIWLLAKSFNGDEAGLDTIKTGVFLIFPFVGAVFIASLVRWQKGINLRSTGAHDLLKIYRLDKKQERS